MNTKQNPREKYLATQRHHAFVNEGVLVRMTECGMNNSMFRHIDRDDIGVVVKTPDTQFQRNYTVMFAKSGLARYMSRSEFKFASPVQSKANKVYTEEKRIASTAWMNERGLF
tara:strand:+ start:8413 stop:8751 length:339 start_codon:yes stop_codon:yes gene_type:complete